MHDVQASWSSVSIRGRRGYSMQLLAPTTIRGPLVGVPDGGVSRLPAVVRCHHPGGGVNVALATAQRAVRAAARLQETGMGRMPARVLAQSDTSDRM